MNTFKKSFCTTHLWLLLLSGISLLARAGVSEPWQRWSDRPPLALLVLEARVKADNGTIVTLNVSDLSTNLAGGTDCDTLADTNRLAVMLQPHTPYSLTATGSAFQEIQLLFKPYTPRRVLKYQGTGAVPKPYKVFVDNAEIPEDGGVTNTFASGCTNNGKIWQVEIRPDRGFRPVSLAGYEEQWRRDEDNVDGLSPGDGVPLEIGPGMSTNAQRCAFRWGVNMGRLWNGNSAGLIRLQERNLSSNVYTAGALSFTERSTNTTELMVITNGTGQLRQIKAPQALADIQSTNGECALKFYLLCQVGTLTNGLFPILTNAPFVTWRVRNPDGSGAGTNLQLVEERPGRTN
ncbi:MAG: hypothetical protein HY674_14890, partial [Chloroflexi bacterium]|nr:hypothetical protein [Chloroflexota bacterium]